MKNLKQFNSKIEFVLTDIDDTLTTNGQLHADAYQALWRLHDAGLKIIPITGRPAGWCEMIARFWPIAGIVGENGGFYFRYDKKMHRWFFCDDKTIKINQQKLFEVQKEILSSVPGAAISSDQFCRLMDLAIDFCEDVTPLDKKSVQKIVEIFTNHGAQAKVSSIHVNGWFGDYNKLKTSFNFLKNEMQLSENDILTKCIFVGDSPNDEPMFEKFPHSFGVANVRNFEQEIKHLPQYISESSGGKGFAEIADRIIQLRR
ncbi:MAG: HAD-IIB family hydrolase [Bdellovibrio sp.]|nr:HAD-IIB family hydrolase [Bdellovibrio sp.]